MPLIKDYEESWEEEARERTRFLNPTSGWPDLDGYSPPGKQEERGSKFIVVPAPQAPSYDKEPKEPYV